MRAVGRCGWWIVLVGVSAGCDERRAGICDDTNFTTAVCLPDAGPPRLPDAYRPSCDPVTSASCFSDAKCTWARINDNADSILMTCVPVDGTEVGLAEACMTVRVSVYETDNCAAGLYCFQDRCARICDPEQPACPDGQTCVLHADLFLEDGTVWAGLCE